MMISLRRETTAVIAAAAIAMLALSPAVASAAQPATAVAIPVVGSGGGATFAGTATLTGFAVQNGQVMALGTVTGTVTTLVNNVPQVTSVVTNFATPVSATQAACDILNLMLGPLHLNVLGLVIDLNQVVLNITAQPGPGNLLGNLLCSVAGLLDNPNGLARLLNQLLGVLAGL